mgnify:CR=1 FL=1
MNNIKELSFMKHKPQAVAIVKGSPYHPMIQGKVSFYQTKEGVVVIAQITGLPENDDVCRKPIFAMHVHSGKRCSGNANDFFADAMTHFNPNDCLHPYHAGDLPPLFGVNGQAFSAFLTNRFSVEQIKGKTVIIHDSPDDFSSQPAGNSGKKIACGIIT